MNADTSLALVILGLFFVGLLGSCWYGARIANRMLDGVIIIEDEETDTDPEIIPWRKHT